MLFLRRKEIERDPIMKEFCCQYMNLMDTILRINRGFPEVSQIFFQKIYSIFLKYHLSTQLSHFHVNWKFSTPWEIIVLFLWQLTIKRFLLFKWLTLLQLFLCKKKQPKYWKHIVLCIVTAKPKICIKNLLQYIHWKLTSTLILMTYQVKSF